MISCFFFFGLTAESPTKPGRVTITESMEVEWTQPELNGSSPIIHYHLKVFCRYQAEPTRTLKPCASCDLSLGEAKVRIFEMHTGRPRLGYDLKKCLREHLLRSAEENSKFKPYEQLLEIQVAVSALNHHESGDFSLPAHWRKRTVFF